MKSIKIIKIKNNVKHIIEDYITEEISLTIVLNDKKITSLICSPYDIRDLVYGFLFTRDFIQKKEDIKYFYFDREKATAFIKVENMTLNKKQSIEQTNKKLNINATIVNTLMDNFQNLSKTFKQTGGVHNAAIVENENIIIFKEDIARHNVIEKLIGNMVLNNISFNDKIILLSCRVNSEIINKIKRCGIQIIISRSAPTNKAIKICRENDTTLIGFVRDKKMNIYSGEQRINIFDKD